MNKLVLDIDLVDMGEHNCDYLICKKETGVFYTSQCGGMACQHLEYEGFLMLVHEFSNEIDDHEYGCLHIQDGGKREELAFEIDCLLRKYDGIISLRFDFDRIDELLEGWWPVKIEIKKINYCDNTITFFYIGEGIICGWNCD